MEVKLSPQPKTNTIAPIVSYWLLNRQFVAFNYLDYAPNLKIYTDNNPVT